MPPKLTMAEYGQYDVMEIAWKRALQEVAGYMLEGTANSGFQFSYSGAPRNQRLNTLGNCYFGQHKNVHSNDVSCPMPRHHILSFNRVDNDSWMM